MWILVNHLLVEITASVKLLTVILFVHVNKIILEHHQIVDPNVSLVLTVLTIKLVFHNSAAIHVLKLVV